MNPFIVFFRLIKSVGLFGKVYTDTLMSAVYGDGAELIESEQTTLSNEEIVYLALQLPFEDRRVLGEALSVLSLSKIVDPDRNREILEKLNVNTEPPSHSPQLDWRGNPIIVCDKEITQAILEELKNELPENYVDGPRLIDDFYDSHNVFREKHPVPINTHMTTQQLNLLRSGGTIPPVHSPEQKSEYVKSMGSIMEPLQSDEYFVKHPL